MAGMDQKDSYCGMFKARVAGDIALRAVFFSLVGRPCSNCGVSAVAVLPGRRHRFRGAEAVSHGPDSSSDHRDFAVAVRVGWLMSLLCGPAVLECRRGGDS